MQSHVKLGLLLAATAMIALPGTALADKLYKGFSHPCEEIVIGNDSNATVTILPAGCFALGFVYKHEIYI